MSFILKNVNTTFQRLMNKVFEKQLVKNVEVYVDVILVKFKRKEDHLNDLVETFNSLKNARIKIKPSKCVFDVEEGKEIF